MHCYLLLEFALSTYFHASNIGESESDPDENTKGCLLDLCIHKPETKWKLRVGYIRSIHSANFRRYGGSEEQLNAVLLQTELEKISVCVSKYIQPYREI